MAGLAIRPVVDVSITLSLNEAEARALLALTAYGDNSFISAFKTKLGRDEIEPWENGVRSLFKGLRDTLPGLLSRVDKARDAFEGKKL